MSPQAIKTHDQIKGKLTFSDQNKRKQSKINECKKLIIILAYFPRKKGLVKTVEFSYKVSFKFQ